jgi:hypothetical protein
MKRLQLSLVVCVAIAAIAPAAASAQPPESPPGCNVVLTTPAVSTGTPGALMNKMEAYTRVCLS